MPELVFFRRGEEVLRFTFGDTRVVLGRGEQCDVVLPDPEVSRQHVSLWMDGEVCRVTDLSGKGTMVGGQNVKEGTLKDGTDLALGRWRAVFRMRSSGGVIDTVTEVGQHTELAQPSADGPSVRIPAMLRIRDGGAKETTHKLSADSFTVGKDETNDLVLSARFVSARHLKVTRHDNSFHIVDQQSTNGTWIGSTRIYEADVPLHTVLRVGEAEVAIEPNLSTNKGPANFHGIIGTHPSILQLTQLIERVAPSNAAVTVLGESGSGKELVANALHVRSTRADRAFIPVNCAAISKELLESELFGHEKGSFTGAAATHKGAFEEADGGTLFLDEIGELPLEMQAKLLRALESGEIKRVGAARPMNVDVRIVAATNRDLLSLARKGKFREDLYYRLCVIPLYLPPLRSRATDILPLAEHFVRAFSPRNQTVRLTKPAVDKLSMHRWPGNVRELRNVVHRALLLRKGPTIDADDIVFDVPTRNDGDDVASLDLNDPPEGMLLEDILKMAEKQLITNMLGRLGNRDKVAKALGLGRSTLYKKLREFGVSDEDFVG